MRDKLDADHWRKRAAEARALAEELSDPDWKRRMLRVAAEYDELADKADGPAWAKHKQDPH